MAGNFVWYVVPAPTFTLTNHQFKDYGGKEAQFQWVLPLVGQNLVAEVFPKPVPQLAGARVTSAGCRPDGSLCAAAFSQIAIPRFENR